MSWLPHSSDILLPTVLVRADGAADNLPDKVRPIPPKGIVLAEQDRADLVAGLESLSQELSSLENELKSRKDLRQLLPDIEIYERAVRTAVEHNEFFNIREIPVAKGLLKQGMERAAQLRSGAAHVEHRHWFGRSRIRFEDRWLGPAVRTSRSGLLPRKLSASLSA